LKSSLGEYGICYREEEAEQDCQNMDVWAVLKTCGEGGLEEGWAHSDLFIRDNPWQKIALSRLDKHRSMSNIP